jgi:hypothetical protein
MANQQSLGGCAQQLGSCGFDVVACCRLERGEWYFSLGIIIFTRLFRVHYSLVPVPVEAEKVSAAGA